MSEQPEQPDPSAPAEPASPPPPSQPVAGGDDEGPPAQGEGAQDSY